MIFPMTPRQYLKKEDVDIFDVIVGGGTYKAKIVTALKSRYNDRMMGRINPLTFTEALQDRYNFLFPRYQTAFSMYEKYASELDEVEGHIRTLVSEASGNRSTAGTTGSTVDRTGTVEEMTITHEKTDGTSNIIVTDENTSLISKNDSSSVTESGNTETVNQNMPDTPLGTAQYVSSVSTVNHGKINSNEGESSESVSVTGSETSDTTIENSVDSDGSLSRESAEGSVSASESSESVDYSDDVNTREINLYKSRAEMLKDAMNSITSPYEMFAFEFNDLFVSRW